VTRRKVADPALAWEAHQQLNIFVGDNTNKWEVISNYKLKKNLVMNPP
jgi:hypothetical protein